MKALAKREQLICLVNGRAEGNTSGYADLRKHNEVIMI